MTYLLDALEDYFRNDADVYVAGNLFVYYREGDPTRVVAPDVFVVKGVPKRNRRFYQVWKEEKGLDVVFELTSRGTQQEARRQAEAELEWVQAELAQLRAADEAK